MNRNERVQIEQAAQQTGRALAAYRDLLPSISAYALAAVDTRRWLAQQVASFDLSKIIAADHLYRRLNFSFNTATSDILRSMSRSVNTYESVISSIQYPKLRELQRAAADWFLSVEGTLRKALEPLRELAERVGRADEIANAFRSYGLWMAPSMPEDLVRKVAVLHERGGSSGTIHSVISGRYARDDWRLLEGAVDRWAARPLFKKRVKSIAQALDSHRRGHYGVSVPALLIHVEGIAVDYLKSNGSAEKLGGKTREVVCAALQTSVEEIINLGDYMAVTSLLAYIETQMYEKIDFDVHYRSLRREKKIVGHAIRHGRQLSYDSRMNSLKFFLILDVLSLLD